MAVCLGYFLFIACTQSPTSTTEPDISCVEVITVIKRGNGHILRQRVMTRER